MPRTISIRLTDSGKRLTIHHDLVVLAKTFALAVAVGLDVRAVSVGVGVAEVAWEMSVRFGLVFAGSEITMKVLGYELGARARKMLGEIGAYAGFGLLALVGVLIIRSSSRDVPEPGFEATRGFGLLMTASASILWASASRFRPPGFPCCHC